ncbi:hypothetical protein [Bradyrhizobium sp. SRS-191]|uniref:hypothetical protein n=1 Tax=Bradyrhizobium sp. SRS-191 TaxID=2962606 RepID=UPI00211E6AD3|nr:hypothetical protein [Bradyrhizobium sp. SRS-191]
METICWLIIGALVLAGFAIVRWDLKHGMHPGEEPAPLGDVTFVPDDQQYALHRARFERMDGVL